ncbi:retropepsin-like aspartic protease [Kordiimonas lacus]|uniref:Aspartyl protease n=1 Tax=Kordiimonas lacus TaxID=637679 RepID=A0A1G6VQQ6_9PROT|nr:retropepsin-like aspartic protease [Kordiimonas lacus]SDD55195.1 Aspartyl protease [Kordiimonas lacus]
MIGFYKALRGTFRSGIAFGGLLLCFAMVAPPMPASAQDTPADADLPEEAILAEDIGVLARLPIDIINNRVHVTLDVNGTPVTMLLDTGASTSVLFKNPGLPESTLRAGKSIDINFPAFRTATTGYRLSSVEFTAGDFRFTSHNTLYIDNRDEISSDLSFKIEGILGRDFFKAYIIEVIPSKQTMAIIQPGSTIGDRFKYRHKLYMDGDTPYLLHRSRLPWEPHPSSKKLLLDTGYPGGIVLWDTGHFNRATDPGEREEMLANNQGVIYYGIIKFGRLLFKNIPIFIGPHAPEKTDDREGIIGASMLLPFRYAVDLNRESLWLNPRVRSFNDAYQISNKVIYTPGNEDFKVKDFPPRISATPTIVLRRDTEVVPD